MTINEADKIVHIWGIYLEYCGDNAAMIAFRGKSLYQAGIRSDLTAKPYPSLGEGYFAQNY